MQLRPDGIFPTKNNNDKDQSLRRKWYKVLYKCVVQFSDFWDRFLLRLLETQMLYVFDDTSLEVDPYELRKPQSRVLGAAVNRVRANQ